MRSSSGLLAAYTIFVASVGTKAPSLPFHSFSSGITKGLGFTEALAPVEIIRHKAIDPAEVETIDIFHAVLYIKLVKYKTS